MVYLFGNLVKDQKAKTKFREFRGFSKILFFSCSLHHLQLPPSQCGMDTELSCLEQISCIMNFIYL